MLFKLPCVVLVLVLATTTYGAPQSIFDINAQGESIGLNGVGPGFGIEVAGPKVESNGENGILNRSNQGNGVSDSLRDSAGLNFDIQRQQEILALVPYGGIDYTGGQHPGLVYVEFDPGSDEEYDNLYLDGLEKAKVIGFGNGEENVINEPYGREIQFYPGGLPLYPHPRESGQFKVTNGSYGGYIGH